MISRRLLAACWVLSCLAMGPESLAQESKQNYEIMKLIRREKMDLILPGAGHVLPATVRPPGTLFHGPRTPDHAPRPKAHSNSINDTW